MKKIVLRAPAVPAPYLRALAALALLIILGHAREARAQWTTSNGSTTTADKVGVGTNAPAEKLHVAGRVRFGSMLFGESRPGGVEPSGEAVESFGHLVLLSTAGYDIKLGHPGLLPRMVISSAGNVGVGVTNPVQKLEVAGVISAFDRTGGAVDGQLWASRTSGATNVLLHSNGTSYLIGGNVGIGTTNPVVDANASRFLTLDAGSAAYAELSIGRSLSAANDSLGGLNFHNSALGTADKRVAAIWGGTGSATNSGVLTFYTWNAGTFGEVMRMTSAGNVGIGTAAPGAKLDVNGAIRTGGPFGFSIGNDIGRQRIEIQENGTTFYFLTPANAAAPVNVGGLAVTNSFPVTPPANGLYVQGSVRVGTSAATSYKLDVNGAANVTGDVNVTGKITGGTIEAKYQDVAEWVPTTQQLQAGTVVVLDPSRINHVLASASSYDTSVAGVVSAQPGIILGEAGEGKVKVATTGRVKVRVDATKGAIRIGDLLVTSDVPGVAMKSEPMIIGGRPIHAPGTIIGKALEPLAGGVGEILVLLSLQ